MTFILETGKKVKDAIAKIGQSRAKWNTAVHQVAVQCVGHAVEHGDVTLGWQLCKAVGGREAQAVIYWLEEFGPFKLDRDDDGNSIGFKLSKKKRDEMTFNGPALLEGVPWHEFSREPTKHASKFDIAAKIAALVKKARELANDNKEGVELLNMDILPELEKFAADVATKKGTVKAK